MKTMMAVMIITVQRVVMTLVMMVLRMVLTLTMMIAENADDANDDQLV